MHNVIRRLWKGMHIFCSSHFMLGQRFTLCLWTICNVASFNAEQCLWYYNFDLRCNTIKGREQKHKICRKYYCSELLANDISTRVYPVNSFERNGYENVKYMKRSARYIPMPKENVCNQCFLEFRSDSTLCVNCSNISWKKLWI